MQFELHPVLRGGLGREDSLVASGGGRVLERIAGEGQRSFDLVVVDFDLAQRHVLTVGGAIHVHGNVSAG